VGSNPTLSEGYYDLDSVKNFIDRIFRKESTYFVALSYVPFVGWLSPLYLKRESRRCQDHAKQGLLLAAFFTVVILFLSLFNILLSKEWREMRLALVILIYVVYLLYFTFCTIGVVWALLQKELKPPLIRRYAERLRL
jgi:cellulose synthase/poly-beta-1,6-N-acetylglucosamine synthase-like glycosyltransferase